MKSGRFLISGNDIPEMEAGCRRPNREAASTLVLSDPGQAQPEHLAHIIRAFGYYLLLASGSTLDYAAPEKLWLPR